MDRDRLAFEAHIRGLLPHAKFNRDDSGEYIAVMVNARWMGWQAALAYVRGEGEGWKIVPVEPTPDMCIKGAIAWAEALPESGSHVDTADACYKAMLAAAPSPSK